MFYDYLGDVILDHDAATPQFYGAKADGIADDYNAIQSAIEANKGGVIYFPKGTYNVSATIKTYPSDANFTHIILHPQAKIVPTASMDYVFDIGGMSETYTRIIGANSRKKYLVGGLLMANNGNVNVAAVHISNNTGDVDMAFMDIHTKDCSCLLLGDASVSTKSTDCYIHNCNMCHDNAENQVSGIIVRSYDNNFSNLRINFHKNGVEVYGGGQYFDNVHTLATGHQSDGVSFITHGASIHLSHCYGDSEGTFIKAEGNALVDLLDCQYYSYWSHDVTFFNLSGTAKIKARELVLTCIANQTNIGVLTPYQYFSTQFSKKYFDVNGATIENAQYLRNGDPLKGMQSNDKQPVFKTTTLNANTWYHVGSFAVDDSSWSNIVLTLSNRRIEIPLSISCSSAGAISGDVGSGKVITDDTGTYQLGFSLANSGFSSSTDYPLINVYLKIVSGGSKTLQKVFVNSNRENPLSTATELPTANIPSASVSPSKTYTINCADGTLVAD